MNDEELGSYFTFDIDNEGNKEECDEEADDNDNVGDEGDKEEWDKEEDDDDDVGNEGLLEDKNLKLDRNDNIDTETEKENILSMPSFSQVYTIVFCVHPISFYLDMTVAARNKIYQRDYYH